jgi:hypothetical protein
MIADIPHAFDSREIAGCGGEIAHGNRRCRHSHGAVRRGAGDHTDRESFHGTPRSIANDYIATVFRLGCRLRWEPGAFVH